VARYDLARLGRPEPDPGRLWRLAETIGGEVVRAYPKLGISGRRDLCRLLQPD